MTQRAFVWTVNNPLIGFCGHHIWINTLFRYESKANNQHTKNTVRHILTRCFARYMDTEYWYCNRPDHNSWTEKTALKTHYATRPASKEHPFQLTHRYQYIHIAIRRIITLSASSILSTFAAHPETACWVLSAPREKISKFPNLKTSFSINQRKHFVFFTAFTQFAVRGGKFRCGANPINMEIIFSSRVTAVGAGRALFIIQKDQRTLECVRVEMNAKLWPMGDRIIWVSVRHLWVWVDCM